MVNNELFDIEHELIVVDNGSTDGCETLATIKNKDNLGISIGKNQCIDAARGELVILLDGDVVPVPNSLKCLIQYMDGHSHVEALGMLPNKGSATREICETHCKELTPVKEIKFTCLFYGIFRNSVFEKVRLDESGAFSGVGYGYEDHDFYAQLKSKGIKQYAAGINKETGRWYHEVNSSIRQMGSHKARETGHARHKQFKDKWNVTSINT